MIITGAAQGIGAAAARSFAEAGANVVVSDLLDSVETVAEELRSAGANATSLATDISKPENCEALVDLALEKFGRLDFAFNNAGIGGVYRPVGEIEVEDWLRVVNVDLNSVFYCIKYQLPAMIKSGGGVIINTSSVCGLGPLAGSSIEYTAAKHGVIGLTKQVALNHAGEGIRCLAICPGYIETALTDEDKGGDVDEEGKAWFMDRIPQGRFGQPEDIGNMIPLLCSDQADYLNGAAIPVDGGFLLS